MILLNIVDTINQCPEYIGKGIMQLIVLTLGGVLVAWITTGVFGRRSEINAVEGTLLKRKMDIYEELFGKFEALKASVVISSDIHDEAVKGLKKEGMTVNPVNSNLLLTIFASPENLTDAVLDIDSYIASKRLYYDQEVMIQTYRFQNYFAIFRRLIVMYEEQFVKAGIALDKEEVVAAECLLTVELGMILQDELMEQMDKVMSVMKQSFKNLNFKYREQITYDNDFFNNPDGPVTSGIINTRLMTQKEKLRALVTNAVALGMVDSAASGKKK